MKSPTEMAARLAKQWNNSALRVERLLSADLWPLEISMGKPTGAEFAGQTSVVYEHVQSWQAVKVGEIVSESVKYRAGAEAVSVPVRWLINTPSEWIEASANETVREEYNALEYLIANVNELYREALIRNRVLWKGKELNEVVQTAELADSLFPGAAKGRPLRLLAGLGVDTKFFERHGGLLTRLLDERYQGAVSELGLQVFLDAYEENDHWVLVVPLDQNLLSFRRQRVTTRELADTVMPCSRILVIENEHCVHLLPNLVDTIAILGAGLDLQWLTSKTFDGKSIAYWGDMDTWGLLMLARSRQYRPGITPLLMDQAVFDQYAHNNAVVEPTVAQENVPEGLTDSEADFYLYLLNLDKGRLEQEYLPSSILEKTFSTWLGILST